MVHNYNYISFFFISDHDGLINHMIVCTEISILFLEATTAMGEELKLTEHEVANFVNDSRWSLIIACALSGYVADLIGRRTTIIISGYVSCLGFMLMASSRSFGMLIAGRVISLAGMGLGLPVTPLYIGEVVFRYYSFWV